MPQPSALSIVFAAVVRAPPVYKWHQPGSHCVGSARRGGAWTLGDEGPVSSLQSDASSDRQGGSDSSVSWHCQHAARVGGAQGHEVHVIVSSWSLTPRQPHRVTSGREAHVTDSRIGWSYIYIKNKTLQIRRQCDEGLNHLRTTVHFTYLCD